MPAVYPVIVTDRCPMVKVSNLSVKPKMFSNDFIILLSL